MSQINRHNLRAQFGKFSTRFIKTTKKRTYEALYNKSKVHEQILTDWGRRIVEINTLAKELWCFKCDIPLSLKNIQSEKQFGLSNIFCIKCLSCCKIHEVHTNKHHTDHTQLYYVNFKLVIALIDAGIGEAHINTILSALNIPHVTGSLIQKYVRLVTPAFKLVANESCLKSVQLEKKMTIDIECLKNEFNN
ncbi:uncharacterized protein LOC128667606 [Microplitis demolitor]|uniref:uncharacterized protein LOC128667605 n=1 Tax=Microplitis demolitor TaxID=69319 RepID=UPI00235B6D96|nr:uncharacterized protein LOC128667605 [Microplitis demolitor]XP_053594401.1 uncharacterized protein LOC128667606 [Microplitis demolitor]